MMQSTNQMQIKSNWNQCVGFPSWIFIHIPPKTLSIEKLLIALNKINKKKEKITKTSHTWSNICANLIILKSINYWHSNEYAFIRSLTHSLIHKIIKTNTQQTSIFYFLLRWMTFRCGVWRIIYGYNQERFNLHENKTHVLFKFEQIIRLWCQPIQFIIGINRLNAIILYIEIEWLLLVTC